MPGKNKPVAKKHKFIKDGIFYAELNTLLAKELAEDGYGGCEVRVTPTRTEVIIRATKTVNVVGPNGRRIKELTALVQKRFKFEKGQIVLFAQMVKNKGLSALAQAEAVRYRLFEGLSVRRAAYSVLKFIMDRGAKGVEVTVSGKLRGQRAKSMKFRDGYMLHAGDAVNYYIDSAVKHVLLRQGVIGIKVKIMLPHDPTNEWGGPIKDLPDVITIHPPKELEAPSSLYESGAGIGGGGGSGGVGGAGGAGQSNRYYQQYVPSGGDIDHSQYAAGPLGMQQQQQQQSQNIYQQQQGGGNAMENDNQMLQQQQGGGGNNYDQYGQQQQGGSGSGSGQGGYDPSFQSNQQYQYDQSDQSYDQYNQYGQQQQQQQQGGQYYDYGNQQDQSQQQGNQSGGGGGGYYNQNQGYYNQNYNRGGQGGQY